MLEVVTFSRGFSSTKSTAFSMKIGVEFHSKGVALKRSGDVERGVSSDGMVTVPQQTNK